MVIIDECLAHSFNASAQVRRDLALAIFCLADMSAHLVTVGFAPADRTVAERMARTLIHSTLDADSEQTPDHSAPGARLR